MKYIWTFMLSVTSMINDGFSQSTDGTYILVHGAGHGAWCWDKVKPALEARGNRVLAIDLPSRGNDTIRLAKVTLEDDARSVVDAANAVGGKVILVGHSSGGVVVSQAAEYLGPGKVDKLVYLDAFLPGNGESVFSLVGKIRETNKKSAAPAPAAPEADMLLFTSDQKVFRWNPALAEQIFFYDCQQPDIDIAKSRLSWNSVTTIATPVNVTASRYGMIRKYYILCTEARDLDKRSIVSNVPVEKVYTLSSSHSPFFSMPGGLVDILLDIQR